MADNTNDELWEKCQQGGPITLQDLKINSLKNSSSGITSVTEGTNYHQFELNSEEETSS